MKSPRQIIYKISHWYFNKKSLPYWVVVALDCAAVVAAGLVSQVLFTGALNTLSNFYNVLFTWVVYCLGFIFGFRVAKTYASVLRYSSFVDLLHVIYANLIGIVIIFLARHFTSVDDYLTPISMEQLVVQCLIATLLMSLVRIIAKSLFDVFYVSPNANRVFIYGVKEGGVSLAKSIRSQESRFVVEGFVSDDSSDCGHLLLGSMVYKNDERLAEVMAEKGAHILLVSPLKSENLRENQAMIDMLMAADIKIRVYSSSQEWDGKTDLRASHLKEVDIEDLLPRNQIQVDLDAISKVLTDQCILITGAAGSIGSEIVRQVASFRPSQMVLIDQAETPLHDIRLMMARTFPDIPCQTITASIVHQSHMENVFKQYRPAYVFHAAAYKHVPMMEDNPGEAIVNNVYGTRVMADLAVKYGAHKFVMVSTDKAVNPTNVMGCSKRICEMYCQSLNAELHNSSSAERPAQTTQFVTTRFGNVLGSNGSVIPLFKEQIKAGGPLTVTHPEIIRYFMLIPEACKLVLQAGTMGNGGEIFVFDMGKPVKIADLAKRMIQLSGATDVQIKYTGLRDGEKLYEELLNKEENTKPSSHPQIKLANVRELSYAEVSEQIEALIQETKCSYDDMQIVRLMKQLVPEFKSKNSKYEALD